MRHPLLRSPRLTLALLTLWALLAVYIIWTRDTLGYIILALVGLFVFLPALVVWLGARSGRQSADNAHMGRDDDAAPGAPGEHGGDDREDERGIDAAAGE